jgi:hypothetical protein
MSNPERPKSRRERIQAVNAGLRHWGAIFGKPEVAERLVTPLPPKRDRIRRPVDGKPVTPSEYEEQGAVIDWWWNAHKGYGLPLFALYSVPNGAHLARGYIGAAMLKKTGMRRGIPDLVLAAPRGGYHSLYVEMKSQGGVESDEQREVGDYLTSAGFKFLFAYGADPAIAAIKEYLA